MRRAVGAEVMMQLAQERRRQRIPQGEVARGMGTSQSYVSKIEHGRVDCSLSTMLLYAEAAGFRGRLVADVIAAAIERGPHPRGST